MTKTPKNRADSRLSNLIEEGGKSQRYIHRDAVTGKYVAVKTGRKTPSDTVVETVQPSQRPRKSPNPTAASPIGPFTWTRAGCSGHPSDLDCSSAGQGAARVQVA